MLVSLDSFSKLAARAVWDAGRCRRRNECAESGPPSCSSTAARTRQRMPDLNAEARLLAVLRRVPRGRVVTYGLLADLVGRPDRARWVARVLQQADDPELPWHRVIAAGGRIALPAERPECRVPG